MALQDTTQTPNEAKWMYPTDSRHAYMKVCRKGKVFHEAVVEDINGMFYWGVYRYHNESEVCTPRSRLMNATQVNGGEFHDAGHAMEAADACLDS